MAKHIVIDHRDIDTPDKVTKATEKAFKDHDLDLHVNEVVDMQDDNKEGKRHLTVQNTRYFFVSCPWAVSKEKE